MRFVLLWMLFFVLTLQAAVAGVEGDWTYEIKDGEAIIKSSYAAGVVTIPRQLAGYPVKKLGSAWIPVFGWQNTNITSLEIPDCVIEIGSEGLQNLSSLQEIRLSKNLKIIGRRGLAGCDRLKAIEIPKTVEKIGGAAFEGCTNLKTVVLEEGISKVGARWFQGMQSLEKINIPDSVTNIEKYAFAECLSLKQIRLSNQLKVIGNYSFIKCKNLLKIEIPGFVEEIGYGAFLGCESLETISLPKNLKRIGGFSDCRKLEKITIPDNITEITENFFADCASLRQVIIGAGVNYIGNKAFKNCSSLEEIVIPKNVKVIGSQAFANCINLETIKIEGDTFVGKRAFLNCKKLKKIVLKEKFRGYEKDLFDGCELLTQEDIQALGCYSQVAENKTKIDVDGYLRKNKWTKKDLLPKGRDVWAGDSFFATLKNGEEYQGICTEKDDKDLIFKKAKTNSQKELESSGETIKVSWASVSSFSSSPKRPDGYFEAQQALLEIREEAKEKFYEQMGGACFLKVKLKDGTLYEPVYTISISSNLGLVRAKQLDVNNLFGEVIEVDWEDIDLIEVLAGKDSRDNKQ